MSLDKLNVWVERAMDRVSLERDQGAAVRESLQWALGQSTEEDLNKDLVAIVAAMEDARAAEEALLDRALMVVGPEAYEKFMKLLDRPAQPNARLRKTMRSKAPWQKG